MQLYKLILYWSKYWIIQNPKSKILTIFAKFHMMISPNGSLTLYLNTNMEIIEALILKIELELTYKNS